MFGFAWCPGPLPAPGFPPRIFRPCCATIKQGLAFYGRPVPCTCMTPSTMLWNCQCTFLWHLFFNDLYNNKTGWKSDNSARFVNFLFFWILYIVLEYWLLPYLVLHFPCNWFLCTSFYGDTGRNICMRHNPALHTLLSLYDRASSITTPYGDIPLVFVLENLIISF